MGTATSLIEHARTSSLWAGILYRILTLRPPVEGKSLDEVLKKVTSGNITPPSAFGATTGKGQPVVKGEVLDAKLIKPLPHCPGGRVPSALSSVVMKALAVDKSKRYQNVGAFSADIEAYQNGFATRAENAGAIRQLVLLMKRHRGVTACWACFWSRASALSSRSWPANTRLCRNANAPSWRTSCGGEPQ